VAKPVESDPLVAIIGQSMQQTQTEATFELQGLVLLLVLGMDVLFPTA
jgi:hypothetical protein